MNEIASDGATVEKLAGGFGFLEGPVWVRNPGYLLFSDIPANAPRDREYDRISATAVQISGGSELGRMQLNELGS